MPNIRLLLLAMLLIPASTYAQAGAVVIPEGTEITVVTTDEITSKSASEGDALTFRVKYPVPIGGVVVIQEGAVVKAVVADAKGAGHLGKAGKLDVRVESTNAVDGQAVRLRAAKGKAGDSKVGSVVVLTVLFGPLGLLKRGHDAVIKSGTLLKVFTDAPISVHTDATSAVAKAADARPDIFFAGAPWGITRDSADRIFRAAGMRRLANGYELILADMRGVVIPTFQNDILEQVTVEVPNGADSSRALAFLKSTLIDKYGSPEKQQATEACWTRDDVCVLWVGLSDHSNASVLYLSPGIAKSVWRQRTTGTKVF